MSDAGNRIHEITDELTAILESRVAELTAAMKSAETVTRQIVTTEMEIVRYRQLQDTLGGEMGDLKRELGALRARTEEVRTQHGGLLAEREKLRNDVAHMERDARDAEMETGEARARLRALEEESENLRRENNDLKSKTKTLEENVNRMRKLKEELMMSISGLSQQMASLNLGSKE